MSLSFEIFPTGPLMGNLILLTNSTTGRSLMFDPGDASEVVDKHISEHKLKVDGIVLTHGHFDHVYGVPHYKATTGAPVYMDLRDNFVMEGNPEISSLIGIKTPKNYPFKVDVDLDGKDEIRFGDIPIRVLHTPGHSPGSVAFVIQNEPDGIQHTICGDTVFENGVGRTDLPGGSYEELKKSLKMLDVELPFNSVLIPGHGDVFHKTCLSSKVM